MSLRPITDYEMRAAGVASLPTRPTAPREFGGRGYSPAELKEAFDRLPRMVAERYNELVEHLADGSYLSHVPYEGEESLRAHLDGTDERIDGMEEDVQALDALTEAHDGTLLAQTERIDAHSASIDDHEARLDELSRVATLTRDLLLGTSILRAEVEDSYVSRPTANGLAVIDGVKTEVTRITGDTVKNRQIFDIPACVKSKEGYTVTVQDGKIRVRGVPTVEKPMWMLEGLNLEHGKTYTFRQDTLYGNSLSKNALWMMIVQTAVSGMNGTDAIYQLNDAGCDTSKTLTIDTINHRYAVYICTGGYPYSVEDPMDATVGFMIVEGEAPASFTPYFRGLRHGVFGGILSADAAGETIDDTFTLPSPVLLGKWDSIDPCRGKRITKTATCVLDGTENWRLDSGPSEHGIINYAVEVTVPVSTAQHGISNHYRQQSNTWSQVVEEGFFISFDSRWRNLIFFRAKASTYPDVETWKAHLASLAAAGDPLTIAYETESAVEEDIDLPFGYRAWRGGTETLLQGTGEGVIHGAPLTIQQAYYMSASEEVSA